LSLLTKHEPINPAAPVTIIIVQKYIKKLYICPNGQSAVKRDSTKTIERN
jgi:hypothetical protein